MLIILDGWGLSDATEGNAIAQANTPNFQRIWSTCPHTTLSASGSDVGLQQGVMGNSEVGHLNIGAGRIVWQDSLLIDQSINDGSFFENESLRSAMRRALENNTRLHLMGLVSNGSVHSSETHYLALLRMAAREGLRGDQVLLHAFTDGRDTAPHGGYNFVSRVLREMAVTGVGAVASVVGRYYAMDRDKRWSRVREAYECLTQGKGHTAPDALSAISAAYKRGETDEFIKATVVLDAQGRPRPRIESGDAVIFFNYRSDRGRELTQCFIDPAFDRDIADPATLDEKERERAPFVREARPEVLFVTMTNYDKELPCPIAFEPREQRDGLGETVAKAGKTQLRAAETEKYPHVTYFFSGGVEVPWPGEERIMAASPQVATYDLQPEMSAGELTQRVAEAIRSRKFDFVALNFANPDMVGHTGVLQAAIAAVETVDRSLGEILQALEDVGGAAVVIADHGNCEQMIDPKTGGPHTAHTTNPVPCILVGKGFENAQLRSGGRLADVAPTLLGLMGIEAPAAITGIDLRQTAPDQLVEMEVGEDHGAAHVARQAQAKLSQAQAKLSQAQVIYAALSSTAPREAGAQMSATAAQVQAEAARLGDVFGLKIEGADSAAYSGPLAWRELAGAARQLEDELAQELDEVASEEALFSELSTSSKGRRDALESLLKS
jgi:2,3-bisphosphoglycerate-independent phosphoglycerate mutase